MKDTKQFWSLTAVVFLAVVMPTILRQVNKITRVMAGAEGRLASINIETDKILKSNEKVPVIGSGTWVYATVAKKGNTIQVTLVNNDPKGTPNELVPVNFLGLEAGNFEYRKTFTGLPTTMEKVSTDAGIIQKLVPMMPNSVAILELEAK